MSDMKWETQCIADKIAEDDYEREFDDLPGYLRLSVWLRAEAEWRDRQLSAADEARVEVHSNNPPFKRTVRGV